MHLVKSFFAATAAVFLPTVYAISELHTVGFSTCSASDAPITVNNVDISFDKDQEILVYDVSATSTKQQNVTAKLLVTVYGRDVYSKSFNPCEEGSYVEQLCPVPEGTFTAKGSHNVPQNFVDLIPDIAFQIPDIAAVARLELTTADNNMAACIQSQVTNGKTTDLAAVSWAATGIAGAALIVSGISAFGAGAAVGTASPSPSFVQVVGWMQGMAMNGMLSVNYPPIYRSFTQNFAFTTGLVGWDKLQIAIDNFRSRTGGNLTADSLQTLRNTTLVFADGSRQEAQGASRRSLELVARAIVTRDDEETGAFDQAVSGIRAFVEKFSVPQSNTFMTILLVVAIIILSIVVGILLVKVILEVWALYGSFPKSLSGFRQHYWGSIARAVTSLVLLLYGVWVLYCVFQFTQGDSWAAKTLAGVTLVLFTALLAFFTFKIWRVAHVLKKNEGDVSNLYDKKELWVKYSIFYESYRKAYWWVFVPTIIYAFVKGVTLAGMDGQGRSQTAVQLIVETAMLILLLWSRPYERRSGNVINIIIQVVRVLSVGCILVFVQEFGISQTTQTVTGLVLVIVQSILTGVLAILILWNGINQCVKVNPHRKRRKDAEKLMARDTLTPLGPQEMYMGQYSDTKSSSQSTTFAVSSIKMANDEKANLSQNNSYTGREGFLSAPTPSPDHQRPISPMTPLNGDRDGLMRYAAPIGSNGSSRDDSFDQRWKVRV
ncbi:transient receptor potential ion channel [Ceratocystis lukuohia]|uniref:Transient receptor potential ion channel n=1 Tax=Ceratocystis lukuohia TaxID=2019550 RepID=A0ABR4MAK4_9PEZI